MWYCVCLLMGLARRNTSCALIAGFSRKAILFTKWHIASTGTGSKIVLKTSEVEELKAKIDFWLV